MSARLHPNYWLVLLLLLGFGLRLNITLNNLDTALAPDEQGYFTRAQLAAADVRQDRAVFRPPLYSYTLALVFMTIGEARFIIGAFHSLLDTLSIALMYALTRALFVGNPSRSVSGRSTGAGSRRIASAASEIALLAALLFAFSPTAAGLVGTVLSEPLFICLTLAGFTLTLRAARTSNLALALLGGAALALAALTREVNLYFALLVVPVWLFVFGGGSRRTRLALAALFVGGMFVVLTPWIARNAVVEARLLLVSSSGEYNFARDNVRSLEMMNDEGETPGLSDQIRFQILEELEAQAPGERASYALRRGVTAIAEGGLFWLGRKAASIRGFWTPFRFERVNLGVRELEPQVRSVVSAVIAAYLLGLLVFATLGLIAAPDTASKLLIAGLVLYSLALFILTHYQLRYRYPVHVLLTPYAAYGIWLVGVMVRERKWDRQLLTAPRLVITLLTLAVFTPLIVS